MRDAVLETIATLSARDANFILTHAGYDDDPEDQAIYEAVVATAAGRGATFVPVALLCAESELMRRVVSPEREARLKCMDPVAAARETRTRKILTLSHPNLLTLDTTAMSAADAAQRILAHLEAAVGA